LNPRAPGGLGAAKGIIVIDLKARAEFLFIEICHLRHLWSRSIPAIGVRTGGRASEASPGVISGRRAGIGDQVIGRNLLALNRFKQ
jgi:hypothetical protein